jgi:hypothetical protein
VASVLFPMSLDAVVSFSFFSSPPLFFFLLLCFLAAQCLCREWRWPWGRGQAGFLWSGGGHGAWAILPCGHPWRLGHGSNVDGIHQPVSRVRGRGVGAKESNAPLENHPRQPRRARVRLAVRASAAPAEPSSVRLRAGARVGMYDVRRKKGE